MGRFVSVRRMALPQRSSPLRTALLKQALAARILVLDGAMGTVIDALNLPADAFGGPVQDGCNEALLLQHPEIISQIHDDYLKAGCDIIETNTFGGSPRVLAEFGLGARAREINRIAAQLACEAAARYSTDAQPRFVAGALGPTNHAISVTGGISFAELVLDFEQQAEGLIEGGVDYLLLETCQDTRNIKAAVIGIENAMARASRRLPLAISGTIEPSGRMLAGQSVEAMLVSVSHLDLLYVGLNCATGPEFMTDSIRELSRISPFPVACVPNAGLPDENGCYLESPAMLTQVLSRFVSNGWINLLGGCCGTHAGHIEALVKLARNAPPRVPRAEPRSYLSGVEMLDLSRSALPVRVGESMQARRNPRFRALLEAGNYEEASELGVGEIRAGAQVLEVGVSVPGRNELEDMRSFMEQAAKKLRVPLLLDSANDAVLELALTYCQGKALLIAPLLSTNPWTKERERIADRARLARKYGAALVISPYWPPLSAPFIEREAPEDSNPGLNQPMLDEAEEIYHGLTGPCEIPPEDIYWNPVVTPAKSADTLETIRKLKARFPRTRISLEIPEEGRATFLQGFLERATEAGLDLVRGNRGQNPPALAPAQTRPLLERLSRAIIEGSRQGLIADLELARQTISPLEIINGPLMRGMDEVGRLFNANQLIVAEVLQSAEVMKAAVAHLEPYLEKRQHASRGKVLLATVKGDVHDIGKNLVEIILANNGFEVVNLGNRVPPDQLIEAIQAHRPDIVGLSGLLVKSAQMMVLTAEDFARAGVTTPLLVGGAALSSNFVDRQIARAYVTGTVAYASDAMSGLDLAKTITDPERFDQFKAELQSRREAARASQASAAPPLPPEPRRERSTRIRVLSENELPRPPDFARHVIRNTPLEQIWRFINPLMLYGRHLGIKGATVRLLERARLDPDTLREIGEKDPKAFAIWTAVEEVKAEYKHREQLAPRAVYRFFAAESVDNELRIDLNQGPTHGPESVPGTPALTLPFPRQRKFDGLCLADYVHPGPRKPRASPPEPPPLDSVAFFLTTVGTNLRATAEGLKQKGDYLKSHILQALALETAEAYAELIHSQIRKAWGYPDPPEMTMMDRFQARYRGKRYSFGYPACPRLDDQAVLFSLLSPEDLGVTLTDGFMMDPESSVSALVFHHPETSYFSVGRGGPPDDPDEDNRA